MIISNSQSTEFVENKQLSKDGKNTSFLLYFLKNFKESLANFKYLIQDIFIILEINCIFFLFESYFYYYYLYEFNK